MTKAERIFKCHKCERRNGSFCGIDKAIISEHASERYCPLGKYKLGLGDVIAMLIHWTGLRPYAVTMMTDIRLANCIWQASEQSCEAVTCGCKETQIKLNGESNG